VRAHADALKYLRAGGGSATFIAAMARFSPSQVIETVKRVSGADFKVRARRAGGPGDPARRSWRRPTAFARRSNGSRISNDLDTIVTHALAWERKLAARQPVGGSSSYETQHLRAALYDCWVSQALAPTYEGPAISA